jgi:uncharacterized protein
MREHGAAPNRRPPADFPRRYGAWGAVAGASQGLGAAYARALAGRGMNLVLAARRMAPLEDLAEDLRARFGVEVRCTDGDLADADFLRRFSDTVASVDLGVLVYNAAHAPVGEFASLDPADIFRAVDVNVRGPVTLLRSVLPSMIERGCGAVVLMSSLAGNQGSPRLSTYAATKAFNRVLAEGLWHELRDSGVDVLACCVGAVRTPGYSTAAGREAPGTLDPDRVAEYALRALGRGPVATPGFVNRAATLFMTRILPRRAAIGIMAGSTNDLSQPKERKT